MPVNAKFQGYLFLLHLIFAQICAKINVEPKINVKNKFKLDTAPEKIDIFEWNR